MTLIDKAEALARRARRPDGYTECECGAWVHYDQAFICDDGPTLCRDCAPTAKDIARQRAEREWEGRQK